MKKKKIILKVIFAPENDVLVDHRLALAMLWLTFLNKDLEETLEDMCF